ncbi:unnamed protein product [Rotaria sp. Silwood2]|nr:unnamed protein product [Rotaria sp. Silwood2]
MICIFKYHLTRTSDSRCTAIFNGQEIRSINKFQNRQSYVVASGIFIKTSYRHISDEFNDDSDVRINQQNQFSNGIKRSLDLKPWYSSSINGEQLYILPYSCLTMYEIMILNRNLIIKFDQWLNKENFSIEN